MDLALKETPSSDTLAIIANSCNSAFNTASFIISDQPIPADSVLNDAIAQCRYGFRNDFQLLIGHDISNSLIENLNFE